MNPKEKDDSGDRTKGEDKKLDLLKKQEEEKDELVGTLIGEDGKIKADMALPKELELEAMAELLIEQLVSYKKTKVAWRSARNTRSHADAKIMFQQMQYNQLTTAIIQAEYPGARAIADKIAVARAKQLKAGRDLRPAPDEEE